MFSAIVSRLIILFFGTLYPAYASYKAVKTKNVKEYVKWMMYWIVFALFTCAETVTDVFLSWFPFYYEIKIIIVLWLLSPATKGSSILYRKFVHPMLSKREQEIDEYISKAKEQSYHTVLNLGTKGVNYATTVIMQTAIKGGGGLVNQLKKSYSLSDLSTERDNRQDENSKDSLDEIDDVVTEPRFIRARGRGFSPPQRSISGPNRVDMYFPEMDVDVIQARVREPLSHIRSTDDISSGYSSTEYVSQALKPEGAVKETALVRTASVGGSTRAKVKSTRSSTTAKKTFGPSEGISLMDGFRHINPYFESVPRPSTLFYLFQQSNLFNYPQQVVMIDKVEEFEKTNDEDSNDDSSSIEFDDSLDFPNDLDSDKKNVGNLVSREESIPMEQNKANEDNSKNTLEPIEVDTSNSVREIPDKDINVKTSTTEDESDSSTLKSESIVSICDPVLSLSEAEQGDCSVCNNETTDLKISKRNLLRIRRYKKRRAPLPPTKNISNLSPDDKNFKKVDESIEKSKMITAKLVLKQGFIQTSDKDDFSLETTV